MTALSLIPQTWPPAGVSPVEAAGWSDKPPPQCHHPLVQRSQSQQGFCKLRYSISWKKGGFTDNNIDVINTKWIKIARKIAFIFACIKKVKAAHKGRDAQKDEFVI